jgi:hypothetical protein
MATSRQFAEVECCRDGVAQRHRATRIIAGIDRNAHVVAAHDGRYARTALLRGVGADAEHVSFERRAANLGVHVGVVGAREHQPCAIEVAWQELALDEFHRRPAQVVVDPRRDDDNDSLRLEKCCDTAQGDGTAADNDDASRSEIQ